MGEAIRGGRKAERAYTEHDEPFGFLDTVRVWLRIAEFFPVRVLGFFDFVAGAVADEDGLAAPFDNYLYCFVRASVPFCFMRRWAEKEGKRRRRRSYVFTLGYSSQVDFDLCLREHVGRGGHVDEKICIRAQLSAIAFSRSPLTFHNIFPHSAKSIANAHLAP